MSPIPLQQRDQLLIISSLVVLVLLAWSYLVVLHLNMRDVPSMMSGIHPWTSGDFFMMFLMWAIMMVAMMVPSAMRSVLIYARIVAEGQSQHALIALTFVFVSGYLVIWTSFSVIATALQWAMEKAALLSPMMVTTSSSLGAALLVAAGIYQLTPLKDNCLKHCQSPVMFMATHYQKGMRGAFRLGLTHGTYCLGCCWLLMSLLFVGGVMNLIWIFAISLFVLVEKLLSPKIKSARITSFAMIIAGTVYLIRPYLS